MGVWCMSGLRMRTYLREGQLSLYRLGEKSSFEGGFLRGRATVGAAVVNGDDGLGDRPSEFTDVAAAERDAERDDNSACRRKGHMRNARIGIAAGHRPLRGAGASVSKSGKSDGFGAWGASRPRCSQAFLVAMRPRGVRPRKPC